MPEGLYIGLMSGTSVDGIDCALLRAAEDKLLLEATLQYPMPGPMREAVAALSHSGDGEIERLGVLDRHLGQLFADAANALLESAGVPAAAVTAIGSHGQTVRHRPPSGGRSRSDSFSLQIGDPNSIAEITGITTVADFRRRDIASGGEGAPLAPAFHAAAFSEPGVSRAVVNIGGIANVSLLRGTELVAGFDCGPGNTLMDHWTHRHRGETYDAGGRWAASGECQPALLQRLLAHPYLDLRGPRSTGKEDFNLDWLDGVMADFPGTAPEDVQATLTQFTADAIARSLRDSDLQVSELYICGGGAHNDNLRARIGDALPWVRVADTEELGIAADWVEAATFAWLAMCSLAGLSGNAPVVTGAAGPRVLGAIYPGARAIPTRS